MATRKRCGDSWRSIRERDRQAVRAGGTAHPPLFFTVSRLDRTRSDGFVSAATALLDAGASANTGWTEMNHQPKPEWESAIYGAAGVARHPELTRLLLERGADPNDGETPYHVPETYDNATMKVLVESGKLTPESLATLLLRKTDWHDYDGIKWLLERGVAPDHPTHWGKTALHNAVLSDNDLSIIELLLNHGADPSAIATRPERGSPTSGHRTGIAMAARRGRGDVLRAFARRGAAIELQGLERLLAACALGDSGLVQTVAAEEPAAVQTLRTEGGRFLAWFAGVGNTDGVRLLLDLGVPIDAPFVEGEGKLEVAPNSLPSTWLRGARTTQPCACSSIADRPSTGRTARVERRSRSRSAPASTPIGRAAGRPNRSRRCSMRVRR